MAIRVILEDQHHTPSQRLLMGVGMIAALSTWALWLAAGKLALLLWILWVPAFLAALRYTSGSWVRISAERGLSWCLRTPFGTRLGHVELHAADIAELRLEASLLGRLLGLWDLQLIRRDGQPVPTFRFFHRMDGVAEMLHAYLEQGQ